MAINDDEYQVMVVQVNDFESFFYNVFKFSGSKVKEKQKLVFIFLFCEESMENEIIIVYWDDFI